MKVAEFTGWIIMIQEILLNDSIQDDRLLAGAEYSVYRIDRINDLKKSHGGSTQGKSVEESPPCRINICLNRPFKQSEPAKYNINSYIGPNDNNQKFIRNTHQASNHEKANLDHPYDAALVIREKKSVGEPPPLRSTTCLSEYRSLSCPTITTAQDTQ